MKRRERTEFVAKPRALLSLIIFAAALLVVVLYSTAVSDSVGLIEDPTITRSGAIMTFMLLAGLLIALLCKIDVSTVITQQTFRSGMSAAVCIIGVAWLGNTFVQGHTAEIEELGGDIIQRYPWMLAVVLLLASALLYSQAATTIASCPWRPGWASRRRRWSRRSPPP